MEKSAFPEVVHLPEGDPRRTRVCEFLKGSSERCALALYKAVYALYGDNFLSWEPETLWLTLEQDGVTLGVPERNRLQAARTLRTVPASLWDNLVFQQVTQALNGIPFDPEALLECETAHMAWAVAESAEIFSTPEGATEEDLTATPEYDEDVQAYIAVCVQRDGMVCLPDELLFAKEALDNLLTPESKKLAAGTYVYWEYFKSLVNLQDVEFQERPEQVQLAKLAACRVYVNHQTQDMLQDMNQLLAAFS
jgi:hypothetical protein